MLLLINFKLIETTFRGLMTINFFPSFKRI